MWIYYSILVFTLGFYVPSDLDNNNVNDSRSYTLHCSENLYGPKIEEKETYLIRLNTDTYGVHTVEFLLPLTPSRSFFENAASAAIAANSCSLKKIMPVGGEPSRN